MGFITIIKIGFWAAIAISVFKILGSIAFKKQYYDALKEGKSKSECISKGRTYYTTLFKSQLNRMGIVDIETRIMNDLQQHNIKD